MPDSINQLVFKIVLEGKEEVVTIDATAEAFEKVHQSVSVVDNSYKKLVESVTKYSNASITNTKAIEAIIQEEGLNENQVRKTIEALRQEQEQYALGSQGYNHFQAAINNTVNAHQNLVTKGLNPTTTQSTYARMAVQQFGYALGDSSMFAVDFRMGMMGISNNLPFLIQNLSAVKEEAEASGKKVSDFIKGQLTGATGLVLGANLAGVALMTLPQIFEAVNASSKKAADDGLKKFTEELKDMTGQQVQERLSEVKKQLKDINDEKIKYSNITFSAGSYPVISFRANNSEENTLPEKQQKLTDEQTKYNEQQKLLTGHLQNQIDDYDKQIKQLKDEEASHEKIRVLVDKKAAVQQKINDLQKTSKEIADDNKRASDEARQKEEERYNKFVKELELKVQLAELTKGDVNKETLDAIDKLNKKLETKNLSLEREIAIRKEIKSLYEHMIELSDKELQEEDKKAKRTKDYLKEVSDKKKDEAEKEKKRQKDFADLQENAVADQYKKEYLELEHWKSEELLKWKGNNEAIQLIEEQYKNKRNELIKKEYQEKNKVSMSYLNATTDALGTMWDQLIIGGRQAKGPWDAIWLSFRNSALKSLGEILQSQLFTKLLGEASGATSSGGGFFGTLLSGIVGLFSGGVGTAAAAATISPGILVKSNISEGAVLSSSLTKYAQAVENAISKPVVLDMFELNKTMKIVQDYTNKIKS
jgi:hypothetical protein